MGNAIIFGLLAIVAVFAALGMLISRNAVYSALFLILNFATMSVFYILLNAPFLAMVQVTVYAGAIMVLFLFVIMLLGAESGEGIWGTGRWQLPLAILLAVTLIGSFVGALMTRGGETAASAELVDSSPSNLALTLFGAYVFPFEVTGILLLVAVIGLFVLSKKINKKVT